jgi:hypothetical protein
MCFYPGEEVRRMKTIIKDVLTKKSARSSKAVKSIATSPESFIPWM